MKNDTSLAARQYRLTQWAEQVRECRNRPGGISVDEWCRREGLTKSDYYYRLRQVRKACLELIPGEPDGQRVVAVPDGLTGAGENSDLTASSGHTGGIEIYRGGFRVHVAEGTPPALLDTVLRAVSHAE